MAGFFNHAGWMAATLLTATAAVAAPRVLVVPGADDAAVRTAVATVGTVADIDVATAAATAELIEAASASGLTCAAADAGCWHRLGSLGGYERVLLLTADAVVVHGDTIVSAPRLQAGVVGIGPAVRRAFEQRSALQITVEPAGAVVLVDGVEAAGVVVDDLVPGAHVVEARADGFAPASITLDIAAGIVTSQALRLEPVVAVSSSSSPLRLASFVTMGIGGVAALGGVGVGVYGEVAGQPCYATSHGVCDVSRAGWLVAIGGGAVVAVGAVLFGFDALTSTVE